MKPYVGDETAEAIVLGQLAELAHNEAGVSPSDIDRHMLQFGDESMSLRDVTDAVARLVERGEAERVGPVRYRITEKGRARLRGEAK
jgi:hypothetical protein